MKPLTLSEILPYADYQKIRSRREVEVLASKEQRRVFLGDAMMMVFENRMSVWWQVQEMCRVEGISSVEGIQHELDTYNALLPTANELSGTLMIGYADPSERDRRLRALVGLQHHLSLRLDGQKIEARFDGEQFNEERVSSVQFVRFPLTPDQRASFLDFSKSAAFEVDHPAYQAHRALSAAVRGALVEDLLEASAG